MADFFGESPGAFAAADKCDMLWEKAPLAHAAEPYSALPGRVAGRYAQALDFTAPLVHAAEPYKTSVSLSSSPTPSRSLEGSASSALLEGAGGMREPTL